MICIGRLVTRILCFIVSVLQSVMFVLIQLSDLEYHELHKLSGNLLVDLEERHEVADRLLLF